MIKEAALKLVEEQALNEELTRIMVATGGLPNHMGDLVKTAAWYAKAYQGAAKGLGMAKDVAKGSFSGHGGGAAIGAGVGATGGVITGASGKDGSLTKAIGGGVVGGLAGGMTGRMAHQGLKSTASGKKALTFMDDKLQIMRGKAGEGVTRREGTRAANKAIKKGNKARQTAGQEAYQKWVAANPNASAKAKAAYKKTMAEGLEATKTPLKDVV